MFPVRRGQVGNKRRPVFLQLNGGTIVLSLFSTGMRRILKNKVTFHFASSLNGNISKVGFCFGNLPSFPTKLQTS